MSFAAYDESPGWGPADPPAGDVVTNAIRKEKLLKDIAAAQDDLRALLGRVQTVQSDVDKLTAGNATLQMYIDNLTMQMAKRR